MSAVLDASALLAWLQREPGSDTVKAVIGDALVSTVNWTEVVQKMSGLDDETETVRRSLQSLGLKFEPFSTVQAEIAGGLDQIADCTNCTLTSHPESSDHSPLKQILDVRRSAEYAAIRR